MADILGTFRQKAEDLIASINSKGGLQATIDGLRRQMAEADRRRAMHKVRSELKQLDAQINEMVTAVGVQAVGLHKVGRLNSEELKPLCQHVAELEAAVEQQRSELSRLEALAETSDAGETVCGQCGRALPPQATFCPHCGAAAPAPSEPHFCIHCGAELRDEARFCSVCGEVVTGS